MPFLSSVEGTYGYGRPQVVSRTAYLYYRWRITQTKSTPDAGACQASEFVFQINGVDQQSIMSAATATNTAGRFAAGETPSSLIDGNLTTKMCDQNFTTNGNLTVVIFQFSSARAFTGYRWGTANDFDSRDPASWTIDGSQNGTSWTTLHTVSGFTATATRNTYNTPAWTY